MAAPREFPIPRESRPRFGFPHCVAHNKFVVYVVVMNTSQFRRWLKKQGCVFETHKGGSGHLTVKHGARVSQLPQHSGSKQLGRKLMEKIKKDLGLN